ncbi:UNKNOWN [Stylonychia lemnae]|uniref:Uncharacterized protein n=1 Tax=Stylonychia lemnae TaxID=5949 RepID=A0A078AIB8_STYLE|nr:UNKNOWN [Stylonychia lemnae]|eukprot:CDW81954.1 UNKNOWN [Stylonychia lemnae]
MRNSSFESDPDAQISDHNHENLDNDLAEQDYSPNENKQSFALLNRQKTIEQIKSDLFDQDKHLNLLCKDLDKIKQKKRGKKDELMTYLFMKYSELMRMQRQMNFNSIGQINLFDYGQKQFYAMKKQINSDLENKKKITQTLIEQSGKKVVKKSFDHHEIQVKQLNLNQVEIEKQENIQLDSQKSIKKSKSKELLSSPGEIEFTSQEQKQKSQSFKQSKSKTQENLSVNQIEESILEKQESQQDKQIERTEVNVFNRTAGNFPTINLPEESNPNTIVKQSIQKQKTFEMKIGITEPTLTSQNTLSPEKRLDLVAFDEDTSQTSFTRQIRSYEEAVELNRRKLALRFKRSFNGEPAQSHLNVSSQQKFDRKLTLHSNQASASLLVGQQLDPYWIEKSNQLLKEKQQLLKINMKNMHELDRLQSENYRLKKQIRLINEEQSQIQNESIINNNQQNPNFNQLLDDLLMDVDKNNVSSMFDSESLVHMMESGTMRVRSATVDQEISASGFEYLQRRPTSTVFTRIENFDDEKIEDENILEEQVSDKENEEQPQ